MKTKILFKTITAFVLVAMLFSSFGWSGASASSPAQGGGNPYVETDEQKTQPTVAELKANIDNTKPVRAIVQLESPPLALYRGGIVGLNPTSPKARGEDKLNATSPEAVSYLAYLAGEQQAFRDQLASVLPDARIERGYMVAVNGMVVKTTLDQLNTLRGIPGVTSVTPEREYKVEMDASLPLVGLGSGTVGDPAWIDEGLWDKVGGHDLAGKGIKIADIDSGITPDHACFDGTGYTYPAGFPKGDLSVTNKKIIAAYGFFREDDPPFYGETPVDDPGSVQGGHGTHTAGTMACNYGTVSDVLDTPISGVAPKAQLMVYRVFYYSMAGSRSAWTPEIIAAIEQVIKDGADVVNNSWGGTSVNTVDDPEIVAYTAAVEAGVTVVFSAGNSGPGSMTVGNPGLGEAFITVGASTTDRVFANPLNVTAGAGTLPTNVAAVPGEGVELTSDIVGDYKYYSGGSGIGCSAFPASYFAGKIAVIKRGTCTFAVKVTNAYNAGAIAVVVVNSSANPGAPSVMGGLIGAPIPAVMISYSYNTFFTSTSPTGSLEILASLSRSTNSDYQDRLAGFSSRGPTPDARIKPDLVAPGVDILSSVSPQNPGESPSFALFQGTSMAAPHVTGAAALMVQLHPDWTPAQIKSALMTTAFEVSSSKMSRDPTQRGSGRLDLTLPDEVTAAFDMPSVSFGIMPVGASKTLSITATDLSGQDLTYAVTVVPYTGTNAPTAPASLFVPAFGEGTLDVDLTIVGWASSDYGKIVLTNPVGPDLHIPYWVRPVDDLGPADVFLIDADNSPDFGCADYLDYYTNMLDDLGYSYVVWDMEYWWYIDFNVAALYPKTVMFTGDCGLDPYYMNMAGYPLGALSMTSNSLRNYLAQGGRMLITGQDIGFWDYQTSLVWPASFNPALFFGADYVQDSLYRGNLPPVPAMKGDDMYSDFLWGQFTDIQPGWDGAENQEYVDEIAPKYYGDVDALPIFTSFDVTTKMLDGVVGSRMSSEPTLERVKGEGEFTKLGYRTIWLSFGMEGVNASTGFNEGAEMMDRLLAWLDDEVGVELNQSEVFAGVNKAVNLSASAWASYQGGTWYSTAPWGIPSYMNGVRYYRWDFGDGTPYTYGSSSMSHVYTKAGTYNVYVEVGDGFGHRAVAGPTVVQVVLPPKAPATTSPYGLVATHTPTYKWYRVKGATEYWLEVYAYSPAKYVVKQSVPACVSSVCSIKPAVSLPKGSYKWRVRASVNGIWGPSSAWKTFKVTAP